MWRVEGCQVGQRVQGCVWLATADGGSRLRGNDTIRSGNDVGRGMDDVAGTGMNVGRGGND